MFGLRTDIHYSSDERTRSDGVVFPASNDNEFISFNSISNGIKLDAVCDLGDIVRGYEFDPLSSTKKDFVTVVNKYCDNANYPVLFAEGNHDNGVLWTVNDKDGSGNCSMSGVFLPSERYEIVMEKMRRNAEIFGCEGKLYYCCDVKNVRIIVLDTNDVPYREVSANDVDINHHAISEEQLRWLSNTALNTNMPVIILSHCPIAKELLADSNAPDNCGEVLGAISAFQKRGGYVIAVLSGHMHKFGRATVGGVNHFTFESGADKAAIIAVSLEKKEFRVFLTNRSNSQVIEIL